MSVYIYIYIYAKSTSACLLTFLLTYIHTYLPDSLGGSWIASHESRVTNRDAKYTGLAGRLIRQVSSADESRPFLLRREIVFGLDRTGDWV